MARISKARPAGLCAALLTCLTGALLLAGCGSSSDSSSTQASTGSTSQGSDASGLSTSLIDDGALTICLEASTPPLEYYGPDRDLMGFDVAAAKATAEKLGLEARFVPTSFSGILPAIDSGRCDVGWSGLAVTPERTAQFTAVPYQSTTLALLVKGGNPENIQSPEDLSGKTLASQSGTLVLKLSKEISSELEAEGKPGATVQAYPKFEEAMQQLALGRASAVIGQDIEASFMAKKQPGVFEASYRFPGAEDIGVYMKPTNKELAHAIWMTLSELEKSGELKTIAEEEGMPAEGINVRPPIEN